MFARSLAAATVLAASLAALPSQAALVSFPVSLEVVLTDPGTSIYLGEIVTGRMGFDDDLLDPDGDGELLGPDLDLTLSLGSIVATEENDVLFPFLPKLEVMGGVPTFLDVIFREGVNGIDFPDPDIGLFDAFTPLVLEDGELFGEAGVFDAAPVPLPAGAPLLLGGLGVLALLRRRR
jgi:hypothetical protein